MEQYHTLVVAATRAAAAAALAASALIAAPANATPASGFSGAIEWQGPFGEVDVKAKTSDFELKLHTKGDMNLVVTRITIAANTGTSGWHTHPGMSLVTVTAGEIMLYEADLCTGRRIVAGQTFVDEGGGHLHLVRNETGTVAEVGAVQLMERGVPARVDAPRPNNCDPTVQ